MSLLPWLLLITSCQAATLHTVQQATTRDVTTVSNDRAFALLDQLARGSADHAPGCGPVSVASVHTS